MLTIPAGKTITVADMSYLELNGDLVNNGTLVLPSGTDITTDGFWDKFSGAGVVTVDDNSYTTDGVRFGGEVTSSGLDMSADTTRTTYEAGSGTALWEPTVGADGTTITGGTLTLDGATIGGDVTFPALAGSGIINVKLKGKSTAKSLVWNGSGSTLALNGSGKLTLSGQIDLGSETGNTFSVIDSASLMVEGGSTTSGWGIETNYLTIDSASTVTAKAGIHSTIYSDETTWHSIKDSILHHNGKEGENSLYETLGNVVLTQDLTFVPAEKNNSLLIILPEMSLTVPAGITLDLSQIKRLDGEFANMGTLVNNGIIKMPEGTTPAQIKWMNLTGSGAVVVGDVTYGNNGERSHFYDKTMDFSKPAAEGNWKENATLDGDGYHWDAATKTLTLKNVYVTGDILLPDAACAVKITGMVDAETLQLKTASGDIGSGALAVTGGVLNSSIATQGHLTLSGVTMNGGISNPYGGNGPVLTLKNTTLTTSNLMWMPDGGMHLENAALTVNDYFLAEAITMDSVSVLHMNTELHNYNRVTDGLKNLAQYLPSGYTVGIYTADGGGKYNTILDSAGNPASKLVLKNQSSPKPSDSGSTGHSGVPSYTLTFETNGGSTIAKVSKVSGTTIDLSDYVPVRNGYTFDGWYSDSKLTGKITSVKLTRSMTIYAKWTKNASFPDVPDDAYYKDAVDWAVDNGITSGTSATTFSPDTICTRAQAVTFLWRAMGSPEPSNANNPFTDVGANAYYYKAVLWAVEKGITSGTGATAFSPDAPCSRGQVVTFQYRAAGSPAVTGENPFADVSANAYYYKAILWAVDNGITGGTSATTFSPANPCTRAQIVSFLFRQLGQ